MTKREETLRVFGLKTLKQTTPKELPDVPAESGNQIAEMKVKNRKIYAEC